MYEARVLNPPHTKSKGATLQQRSWTELEHLPPMIFIETFFMVSALVCCAPPRHDQSHFAPAGSAFAVFSDATGCMVPDATGTLQTFTVRTFLVANLYLRRFYSLCTTP